MSGTAQKRPVWVWVVGAVVVFGLVALIGYNVWRNTPRRFSQICPGAKTATTCEVAVWDFTGEPQIVTGQDLVGLVEYLDQFALYSKPDGRLEGDDLWQLTFIGSDGDYALIHVASQGVMLDSGIYEVRSEAIELPLPNS